MSPKYFSSDSVPAQTARVVCTAFPKGNVYLKLCDHFDTIFEYLFSTRGRPAQSPARLALIAAFQFLERLSDCFAEGVRSFEMRKTRYRRMEKTQLQIMQEQRR
jgi:transposase